MKGKNWMLLMRIKNNTNEMCSLLGVCVWEVKKIKLFDVRGKNKIYEQYSSN